MTYQMFKLRKCIILRETLVDFKFHGINTVGKSIPLIALSCFSTRGHMSFTLLITSPLRSCTLYTARAGSRWACKLQSCVRSCRKV